MRVRINGIELQINWAMYRFQDSFHSSDLEIICIPGEEARKTDREKLNRSLRESDGVRIEFIRENGEREQHYFRHLNSMETKISDTVDSLLLSFTNGEEKVCWEGEEYEDA